MAQSVTLLSPVLPLLRGTATLVYEAALVGAAGSEEGTRAAVASIELHMKQGDDYYNAQIYDRALTEFRAARAEIYALLYPSISAGAYVLHGLKALPISPTIEAQLLNVSADLIEALRPRATPTTPITATGVGPRPQPAFRELEQTGFQEVIVGEATLVRGAVLGAELLNAGKPQAAANVLSAAAEGEGALEREAAGVHRRCIVEVVGERTDRRRSMERAQAWEDRNAGV